MKKRIGLITPYNGYNLGDEAIQDAMIRGLLANDDRLECFGITLYPADTTVRHQIPATNLLGLAVRGYSEPEMLFAKDPIPLTPDGLADYRAVHGNTHTGHDTGRGLSLVDGLRAAKRIPLFGPLLRQLAFLFRRFRNLGREIVDIGRAWRTTRKMHLLLVSGGGQLDESHGGPWGHPYALFRWAMLARLARVPFAVVSVGAGELNSRLSRWFVCGTLGLACYRSYRDQGTKEQLSDWKFTHSDAVVPDVVLSLADFTSSDLPKRQARNTVIAFAPIFHKGLSLESHERVVEAYARFLRWLGDNGYSVLLYRTTSVDRLAIEGLQNAVQSLRASAAAQPVEIIRAQSFQELLPQLRKADLVVAGRLHSIILAHILGLPTLAISWDRKVDAHMADVDQSAYSVDISTLDVDSLIRAFRQMERDSSHAREILIDRIGQRDQVIQQQFVELVRLAK